MKRYSSVDDYLAGNERWKPCLELLREILISTYLDETVKWGAPIYTLKNKNVVGIGAFKSYVGLWFHQGALLNDDHKKLINAQEGVTQALRQWRFNSLEEIEKDREIIQAYIQEAILNQEQGKEIKPQKKPLVIPSELQDVIEKNPELRTRFESFSLTYKREYADYISEAKRPETRVKRLDKVIPMILEGVGLNDKYRK